MWRTKLSYNAMVVVSLIASIILFNPGIVFGQEQQEEETNQAGFEDEFIVDEPEITEPEWAPDHDPNWSNTLDSALQDPYFVDLLAQSEAHGDASHLDLWSNHEDSGSHDITISAHTEEASHVDVWSNHSDDQSHSPDFSNHTDDMSHVDIYSQIDNYLGTP